MKKTDLSFKDSHDENGIPICCMTCEKWSFSGGKSCGVDDYTIPCPKWQVSKYYANKKYYTDEIGGKQ